MKIQNRINYVRKGVAKARHKRRKNVRDSNKYREHNEQSDSNEIMYIR
jgi:hypothetical protein